MPKKQIYNKARAVWLTNKWLLQTRCSNESIKMNKNGPRLLEFEWLIWGSWLIKPCKNKHSKGIKTGNVGSFLSELSFAGVRVALNDFIRTSYDKKKTFHGTDILGNKTMGLFISCISWKPQYEFYDWPVIKALPYKW